jgi:signal transduction histidine kinase
MQRSFPVDRYPGPVCGYDIEAGVPVVRGVNPPFETQFGSVDTGAPVAETLDSLGIAVDATDLTTCLSEGDRFTAEQSDAAGDHAASTYLVQTMPPEDGEWGFLVFVETDDVSGVDVTPGALGVDHVASVISHDLRNPLDVAKARLRAGRDFDEPEHFGRVEQAHERMERIIEDVLTLARGEDVVDPDEPVDLGAVAETAWETVETNGSSLTVADPLPTATADPDRVGRLFENLFRNAVEHGSGDGADGVTVSVGRLDGDSEAGLYVADDGSGIPSADRERVFEPGYSSNDHGTGLGLAIAARIVDLHGWSISVTDAADGGARFEIRGLDPD